MLKLLRYYVKTQLKIWKVKEIGSLYNNYGYSHQFVLLLMINKIEK